MIDGVIETSECPRSRIPADWTTILSLYRHYRNGFLFTAGGISDQPELYQDVMRLVDIWVAKFSEAKT